PGASCVSVASGAVCANAGVTNIITSRWISNAKDHGALSAAAVIQNPMPLSDGEQEKESDEQREDAQSFRNGEAEHQTAELAVSGGRIAQGARQIAAEDVAEAKSRAGHAKASETCADELCCFRFHE